MKPFPLRARFYRNGFRGAAQAPHEMSEHDPQKIRSRFQRREKEATQRSVLSLCHDERNWTSRTTEEQRRADQDSRRSRIKRGSHASPARINQSEHQQHQCREHAPKDYAPAGSELPRQDPDSYCYDLIERCFHVCPLALILLSTCRISQQKLCPLHFFQNINLLF